MKQNKVQSLAEVLQKASVQKASVFAAAFLVVGTVAYFGTHVQRDSFAAVPPPNAIYISPETGTYQNGQTFTATVRTTTGTNPVNAVQASITYNTSQLQFVSLSEGTAFPTVAATSTGTAGLIRFARATQSTPVSGDNAVVTVTFKMLAASGTSGVNLTVDPAYSYIVRSTDNTNIMTGSAGSSFSVSHLAPTVSNVSPTSGPLSGGTVLTINGSNFRTGASVTVGGVSATGVTLVSATQLRATTPSATASGAKNIVVSNSDGQSATLSNAFSYVAAPTISSISPISGSTAGGTVITINGSNFVSGATVKIGTANATGVTFVSSTQVRATTPSGTAGARDVVVTNPDGQSVTRAGGFTYNAAPIVSSITPTNGPANGGTNVTISGTGFLSGATVTIGGTAATNVIVSSSSSMTARTAARAAGTVDVRVTNADGQFGVRTSAFTYNAAPSITAVSPNNGYVAGGTSITISGTGFLSGATVTVGGASANSVVVVNGSTITVKAPSNSTGVKSVVVTNADGQSATLATAYTYLAAGDVNRDGRVNVLDLSVLISKDGQTYPEADFNGDGIVGSADMAMLLAAWTW